MNTIRFAFCTTPLVISRAENYTQKLKLLKHTIQPEHGGQALCQESKQYLEHEMSFKDAILVNGWNWRTSH
jgi:hypothetical protein